MNRMDQSLQNTQSRVVDAVALPVQSKPKVVSMGTDLQAIMARRRRLAAGDGDQNESGKALDDVKENEREGNDGCSFIASGKSSGSAEMNGETTGCAAKHHEEVQSSRRKNAATAVESKTEKGTASLKRLLKAEAGNHVDNNKNAEMSSCALDESLRSIDSNGTTHSHLKQELLEEVDDSTRGNKGEKKTIVETVTAKHRLLAGGNDRADQPSEVASCKSDSSSKSPHLKNTNHTQQRNNLRTQTDSTVMTPTWKRVGKSGGDNISSKVRKIIKSLQMGFLLTPMNAPNLLKDVTDVLQDDTQKQLEFGAAQGIPPLLVVMDKFQDEAAIQEQCCRILGLLSQESENQNRIGRANGGIKAVLVAMLKHYNIEMQQLGCTILANLAQEVNNKDLIPEISGIEVVLIAMHAYINISVVQAEACRALSNLAQEHTPNSFKIAASGGIKAIQAALQEHKDDRNLQLYSCCAFRHLTTDNDSNRGAIASAGSIASILAAMRHFAKDTDIQENACAALWNLTRSHKQNARSIWEQKMA